jgi:CBS domain containing-hemolysin-like protein
MVPFVLAVLLIVVFALASFFFAVAETSLFSLSKWQIGRLSEHAGTPGAKVASLLAKPQELLATIVLGNTVTNAGMVVMGLWFCLHGDWPAGLTVTGIIALVLLGCEVAPKTLAVRQPDRWALRVAQPMQWIMALTRPVRWLSNFLNTTLLKATVPGSLTPQPILSEGEYQELLELAFQQGTIEGSEKEIILRIISLDRRIAREVMRPRSTMACISDDLSIEDMVAACRRLKHRRLPIYDEAEDTIVGVLNTRTLLLDPQADLAEAIEFPSFVPETMNLFQLLKSLQRQQRGLAIVLDEYGGVGGLVTVEDILEEVIGEIRSEGEESGFVMEKLGQGRWRVSGTMRQEDFQREYPLLQPLSDVETLGGVMLKLMECVPARGDSVLFQGLTLTAAVVDERRVREIIIEVARHKNGTGAPA